MSRSVRLLSLPDSDHLRAEMVRMEVDPAGIKIMLAKSATLVVKVDGLSLPAAHALKQEMLSEGADAALPWRAFTFSTEPMPALLIATPAQFRRALRHLRRQPFGLAELTVDIEQVLARAQARPQPLRCRDRLLATGKRTLVMGILNLSPDSFSGDGLADPSQAAERAARMVEEGADIIDIGGESTRPGAEPVSAQEETRRILPVLEAIRELPAPVSVDTYKAAVARAALEAGAGIINDITGLRGDPEMAKVAAEAGAALVVMHLKGTPRDMQRRPRYRDLMGEVYAYLEEAVRLAEQAGLSREQVVVDPGFGFGKTVEHNLEILRRLRELRSLGCPVMIGTSRKSTIGKVLGDLPPDQRLEGTAATVALAIREGADLVRVHDVKKMARVARMTDAVVRGKYEG